MSSRKKTSKVLTRQRSSGKWLYRFETASVNGKRKWISKGGFDTQSEAYDAGVEAYNQYKNTGKTFTPSDMSVADYLDYWIAQYCKVNLKKTTVENYEKKIRLYIKPALGSYYLKDIDTAVLQSFINNMFNKGFSRNTLLTVKGILSRSLEYATSTLKFIATDPSVPVRLPLPRARADTETTKKERVVYTKEQIESIFERFPEGHPCHIPLLLGYRCGLRLGEAFALMWSDVDFVHKTLTINKQVQNHDKEWYLDTAKYESDRVIDLDDTMIKVLKKERARQLKAINYYESYYTQQYIEKAPGGVYRINTEGKGEACHFINTRENGTYIQPRVMQHCFRVIHYDLGFEELDYHSLRHTHASNLLAAGVNPKYVQERLGHKNIKTTLQTYSHVTEDMKETSVNILNAM